MKQKYKNSYHEREIKHAFLIGIISVILFTATAFGANALYKKSAKDISSNYETVRVKACEKIESRPAKGSAKYYIRGTTENGYEGIFWVSSELYKKIEVGDMFHVYQYGNCYGSTLHSLISENAGVAYSVLYLTAIMALPASVIFVGIGAVQKIQRWRRMRI